MDYYNLQKLNKEGIFQKDYRNGDWKASVGVLKQIIKTSNSFIWVDEHGVEYDQFIPFEDFNSVSHAVSEVYESIKNLPDEQNLENKATKNKKASKKGKSYSPRVTDSSLNNGEFKKYIGKYGIVWNDCSKGEKDYGCRFDRLDRIVKDKNGKLKFQSTEKKNSYYYCKRYDHFRPLTEEEFNDINFGIGLNQCEEYTKTFLPRVVRFRYKSEGLNHVVLYQCKTDCVYRKYTEFKSFHELSSELPLAVDFKE